MPDREHEPPVPVRVFSLLMAELNAVAGAGHVERPAVGIVGKQVRHFNAATTLRRW
jgi:hypothetical protein